MTEYRSHLLGRVPSEPDERNFQISTFMEDGSASILQAQLDALLKSRASKATKAWATTVTSMLGVTPTPAPTPTPTPSAGKVWTNIEQLDQKQTGHCVGFGKAQFCNTLGSENIDDHYTDADGHAIYYECKIIDGEPGAENGSSVHSGAKALLNRKRIKGYAWATKTAEITAWILNYGPVDVGTDWYDGMFTPNSLGFIKPTGSIAGGHDYIIIGVDDTFSYYIIKNSWGPDWGIKGCAKILISDFEKLLNANGEAMVAVEVV
jgi:hypothetical protein